MTRDDFKSDEEFHFALWCEEARENGLISRFSYEPESYPLSAKKTLSVAVQTPSRSKRGLPPKMVDKHLLHPHNYTPDFLVWPEPEFGFLFPKNGLIIYQSFYSGNEIEDTPFVIDVKGSWANRGGTQEFSINQKWMLDKHRIYVNKVVPQKFFARTWVPAGAAYGKSGKRLKRYEKCKLWKEINQ